MEKLRVLRPSYDVLHPSIIKITPIIEAAKRKRRAALKSKPAAHS